MELQLALEQALGAHREAILAFSQDLISIASENPPGNHYRECVDRIGVELTRLGLPYQLLEVPGSPERPRYNLLSFYGDGQRTLYFHGHYDVVPTSIPSSTRSQRPASSPEEGGRPQLVYFSPDHAA